MLCRSSCHKLLCCYNQLWGSCPLLSLPSYRLAAASTLLALSDEEETLFASTSTVMGLCPAVLSADSCPFFQLRENFPSLWKQHPIVKPSWDLSVLIWDSYRSPLHTFSISNNAGCSQGLRIPRWCEPLSDHHPVLNPSSPPILSSAERAFLPHPSFSLSRLFVCVCAWSLSLRASFSREFLCFTLKADKVTHLMAFVPTWKNKIKK